MSDRTPARNLAPTPAVAGIDPRGPRFSAAITAVLLLVDLDLALIGAAVASTLLLAILCALFAIGAFAGVRRHPWGAVYGALVRPRLGPPSELEDPRPPTFAQGVGFAITLAGLVVTLAGVPAGAVVAAALAFVAAFLNAVFGLCLGCRLYVLLLRAGLVKPRPA